MTRLPSLPSLSSNRSLELSEEERKSLIREAGETALGGIAAVGNLLDVPGSMVRDLLGGENPFDQLLSPMKSKNRLTGRELARKYGMAGRKDTWGNFGGGLGVEILTDPLTYMTFGASALSKAGKVAKKAGILDDVADLSKKAGKGRREGLATTSIKDLLDEPGVGEKLRAHASDRGIDLAKFGDQKLGGSIGIGFPFKDPVAVAAMPRMAKGMDALAHFTRYKTPVRHLYGTFGRGLRGAATEFGQEGAKNLQRNTKAAQAAAREEIFEVAKPVMRYMDLDEIGQQLKQRTGNVDPEQISEEYFQRSLNMREYLETIDADVAEPAFSKSLAREKFAGRIDDEVMDALDKAHGLVENAYGDEVAAGLKTQFLDDYLAAYFPRQKADLGLKRSGASGSLLSDMMHGFMKSRSGVLKNHQRGTRALMEISVDPDISGLAHRGNRKGKLKKEDIDGIVKRLKADYGQSLFEPGTSDRKWRELAKWVGGLDRRHADFKIPIFQMDPIADLHRRLEVSKRAVAAAQEARKIIADHAEMTLPGVGDRPNYMSMREFLDSLQGVDPDHFRGLVNKDLQEKFPELAGSARKVDGPVPYYEQGTQATVDDLWIHKDIAADAQRFVKAHTGTEATNALVQAWDTFTDVFKTGVTALWPSFHVRNLMSGLFQNWLGDAFDVRDIKTSVELLNGTKEIQGLPEWMGKTAAERTERLRQLAFAHGVIHERMGLADDLLGQRASSGLGIPGTKPLISKAPVTTKLSQRINPLNILDDQVFTPTRIGRDVGHIVEGVNRLQPFITMLKKGWDPAEAAKRVGALQVDYASRAAADPVMKRLFPFYSFTRGVLPFFVEELTSRPGGKLGRGIMMSENSHRPDEITPDYVAETLSIPLGTQEDGTKGYLTGFGVMAEDPLSFVGKGVSGGLREVASRLHPALKAPIELATGQSLFQSGPLGGRPLGELDPPIGRTIQNIKDLSTGERTPHAKPFLGRPLEFAIANSPFARAATTARTLTDPRKSTLSKAANTLTGMRVTHVSPAAQKALLAERAEGVLKKLGARDFRKVYLPQDILDQLPPEKRKLALQFNALMREQALR